MSGPAPEPPAPEASPLTSSGDDHFDHRDLRNLQVLLSLSAADALGAATEFKTPQAIQARYGQSFDTYQEGSVFGFAPGEATDDAQMTVATLLGYTVARPMGQSSGELSELQAVLVALNAWLHAGPPDVGGLTRKALMSGSLDGGVRAWQDSGFQSAGNGGLMRIAAVWLAGFRGEALTRQSALVTALTHADPRCVYASVFFTAFLDALTRAVPFGDAAQEAMKLMDDFNAREVLREAEFLSMDTFEAHHAFRERDRQARADVRACVRSGLKGHLTSQSGFVLDTLEAALKHAQADSWLECVQPAVMLGDDSDTVACVVGVIAGARGQSVPEHLLPNLRLGHSWPGWEREWNCTGHYPTLLKEAQRP